MVGIFVLCSRFFKITSQLKLFLFLQEKIYFEECFAEKLLFFSSLLLYFVPAQGKKYFDY